MSRAVAGGHHRDVVAGSHPPVFSQVAEKGGPSLGSDRERYISLRIFVCKFQFFKAQIVRVDVLTSCNRPACRSNPLAIPDNLVARWNLLQRNLVPGRNIVLRDDLASVDSYHAAY